MKKILCSGWHADADMRKDTIAGRVVYSPDYMKNVFIPYHSAQFEFRDTFIYHNRCQVPMAEDSGARVLQASLSAYSHSHAHGWLSSVLHGAVYCLTNKADMVFIEQDCLVYGLDEAVAMSDGLPIVYGYGAVSMFKGWAEHSFFTVSFSALPEVIGAVVEMLSISNTPNAPLPELLWHEAFKKSASYWHFGFGRKRPIDFSLDVFYAQQLQDEEVNEFIKKLASRATARKQKEVK